MGRTCTQNLAMRLQDDLEAHMGFQEDLLRLLSAGIACKRCAGVGATLCPVNANIYTYRLFLRRIDPIFVLLHAYFL